MRQWQNRSHALLCQEAKEAFSAEKPQIPKRQITQGGSGWPGPEGLVSV